MIFQQDRAVNTMGLSYNLLQRIKLNTILIKSMLLPHITTQWFIFVLSAMLIHTIIKKSLSYSCNKILLCLSSMMGIL